MTRASSAPDSQPSPILTALARTRSVLRRIIRPIDHVLQTDAAGPSAAMFARIRNRLIFWYIGVLAAILLLMGVLLYFTMQNTLLSDVNTRLVEAASAAGIAWQEESVRQPGASCFDQTVQRVYASNTVNLAVPYLTCFDTNGNALAQGITYPPTLQNLYQPFYLDPSLARVALAGSTGTANDRIDITGVGAVQRYAQVITAPDGSMLVVEVGIPIQEQIVALQTLLVLLFILGAVTILCASAGGIFLAQRALAPAHLAFERQQAFIADAAHELRTPLTMLRANAEVLLRGRKHLDPDDVFLLEDIVAESAHMGALTNNLLTLARLDSGREVVKRDIVDMVDVAKAIVRQAGSLADERGVSLQLQSSADLALALGDDILLNEVVLILVDNAIKYNTPNGRVILHVDTNASQVVLHIEDTGIGIAQQDLARLGERFYRPDKARSREMGGAGLGLSVARRITAMHNGTLTFLSVPSEGTVATLSLPAAHANV